MRFSVIVPAHNSAPFIDKGLQSIQQQTFKDYELIVVCDSCTDSTEKIASHYTDKVLRVNNENPGFTRNAGLDIAKGDYILFMDSDDWWLHEYVFKQLDEKIQETNPDIIAFSFIFRLWMYAKPKGIKGENYWGAVWNKCWKRDIIGNVRFPDRLIGEDKVFMNQIMAKNPKIVDWDMPMYYYNYMRDGSIVTEWRKGK